REHWFSFLQSRGRRVLVAGGDRFFDLSRVTSRAAAARLVGDGAARGLADGLLRRFGIGHSFTILNVRPFGTGRSRKERKSGELRAPVYSGRSQKRQLDLVRTPRAVDRAERQWLLWPHSRFKASRGKQHTMRILVTGAAGFIGFHTAARLLDRGDEVVGL